ncbi:hypothetical protein FAUST_6678 [Fusarium austroamericanum]|uniref:Uncharacterized protein n=1 Tax=Fusarium austroamericanum TaxID=282268 RepID=A0AAN6BZH9_FUSAU|nr:hypothetical protein FAUST_6678 [Fusarium austroamericanum]
MLLQVNPDSAQTVVGESGPVVSDNDSEPPRYQVFHIEHSPNVHKIFIPTSFPRPAGYLYFVTDLSLQDHPQTTLPVTADVLKSSEQMGDIYQSRFVGYIASQDLDRMRAMIKEHSRPLVPGDYAPLPDCVTRCEVWNLRLQVGIGFLGITTRPTVLTNDFTPIIPTDVGVVSLSTRVAEPTWQRRLGLVLQSGGIG